MAESSRTPPFLLEHHYVRTIHPHGNCIGASIRWTQVARVAQSLRAFLQGLLASTRSLGNENLATTQRAQRRDRTNVCMCHLDHLLSVAMG